MKIKYLANDAHTLSVAEVLDIFQTNADTGLSKVEAAKRLKEFGLNVYTSQKQKSMWLILLEQFKSPIVYLLIFGAAVSLYFQDYIEAVAILVVILVNALIGFLMEMQARSSMNALKEMDIIKSKVIREGKVEEIPSENLTLGDIIVLEAGDLIPGDGRLIVVNQLKCDESSLTGESLPTEKNIEQLQKDTELGDQFNMVFKGSSVMNGNGKAIITGIAEHTQLGTITSLVENSTETATPLDKKLNVLSKKLIWLTLILTSIFAITGIVQGKDWVIIIKTSIVLAIAAFPEGLPIVATVALAYGMLLMAKRNAIVKKLSSVETLGSTSVILTDKTGTLTENKIYVETFSFPEENRKVSIDNNTLKFENGAIEKSQANFEKLRLVGALCNDAIIKNEAKKKPQGDPIEIALLQLADSSGQSSEEFKKQYERIAEVPFSADTKIMGTLHRSSEGNFVAAKGSVEHLLEKCNKIQFGTNIKDLDEKEKNTILEASEKMAADGLRVLAFSYKDGKDIDKDDFLKELIYVGMIGFLDPPRLDIKGTIISCRNAGIKVVMITGDHPLTALNIAKKVGLVEETEQKVIVGKDLPEMKSLTTEWKKKILSTAVFARTTPKQKLDIADIYQKAGNIVAMTGDGVNDAPALKKADVGIAMGLRGTQVAKETASIVLKDDKFKSIVEAISHGRAIFQNIKKFVIYLVSCNLSEIFIVTLLGFLAPAAILLPLQILFLNMVTDVFPALALGLGKGDRTNMKKPPRSPKKDIIENKDWIAIMIYAITITLSVAFAVIYCQKIITPDNKVANNVAFITLAFAQLFHVFNMSSLSSKLWMNDITKNKFVWLAVLICTGFMVLVYISPQMRLVLSLVELPTKVWFVSILASLIPLVVVQLYKIIFSKNH
ncbi:cation-translocating P-type ATPase [Emticicia sp. SJ17W-69]|uniref:cation-translocating P-type ATPase n=1 Tax=Emticicia sp. SJ17W-69 TaxID=3421657 RepID=UPI003EBC0E87